MVTKNKKTGNEQFLTEIINKNDDSWKTITEDDIVDYSLSEDPYKLPKAAQEKLDDGEFVFRWIERKPERIEEISNMEIPFRWWICNSTNTPFLEDLIDSCDGGIHCKDQILMFKPYWMAKKVKNIKNGVSNNKINSGLLKSKSTEMGDMLAGEEYKITGSDVIMAEME